MNVTTQKFQSQYELVGKTLAQSNHRTTLPQSAHSGCQLPQRGSREGLYHSTGCSLNREVTGDFHRPYEKAIAIHPTARKLQHCGI